MDCLSSEDLKGRRRNSLCLTDYAECWCCQVGNVRDRALQLAKQTQQHTLGDIVSGVFTPALAKHSKSFSLIDCISVGVDRICPPVYSFVTMEGSFQTSYLLSPETTDTTIRQHYAGRRQNEYALNLAMNLVIPLIPFSA
jgi:hypothetical protein